MAIATVEKEYTLNGNKHIGYMVTYDDSTFTKSIPMDLNNYDYVELKAWIDAGGTVVDNPPGE